MPGDVVGILAGTATCDMVLLRGNCLVEESNLSGEVKDEPSIVAAPQHDALYKLNWTYLTCIACVPQHCD